ncbi:hypothetical protein MHB66_18680 [Bacillus sp. FSL L8-0167]|uniref:hypothetical protein n=1 Tax=Bacillus TaxID=1386 RepID=UPI00061A9220|nr:hypothetical protein [Bacillus safensis]MBY0191780.1 hypothetical protein [Bacillus aerophilus]KKD40886.1 hypothetical protein KU48_10320 [Bacillus safensis]MCM3450573.1 hypothetical protein [Bacillus safensis]MDR6681874.1 hypothetical protein [Bacillus safensis]MEC0948555.1 hypothetical protein [Bacillus safensis]
MTEEIFKDRIIGAINTCIRLINESDQWDIVGKGIIKNEWKSYVMDNEGTFVAELYILNNKKTLYFEKKEWFGAAVNIHDNKKLNELISVYG